MRHAEADPRSRPRMYPEPCFPHLRELLGDVRERRVLALRHVVSSKDPMAEGGAKVSERGQPQGVKRKQSRIARGQ